MSFFFLVCCCCQQLLHRAAALRGPIPFRTRKRPQTPQTKLTCKRVDGPEERVVRERARGEARGGGGGGRLLASSCSRCCCPGARARRAAGGIRRRRRRRCGLLVRLSSSRSRDIPSSCSSTLEHGRGVAEERVLAQGGEGAEGRGAVFCLRCWFFLCFFFQGEDERRKQRRHRFSLFLLLLVHPLNCASPALQSRTDARIDLLWAECGVKSK